MAVAVQDLPDHTILIDPVAGTNPIYIGIAPPGVSTSAGAWQIRRVTYDGTGFPTAIQFANGSSVFNAIWDDRASLAYI